MKKLVRQKSLDIPDPEESGPAPIFLVPDENGLKTDGGPAGKAPNSGVRYDKSLYFIDNDIFENLLISVNINFF